ncbi:hypothetical protein ACHAXS_013183, partial [Conticribra weissflogii]
MSSQNCEDLTFDKRKHHAHLLLDSNASSSSQKFASNLTKVLSTDPHKYHA